MSSTGDRSSRNGLEQRPLEQELLAEDLRLPLLEAGALLSLRRARSI